MTNLLQENQVKLKEITAEQQVLEKELNEIDQRFTQTGKDFEQAKEACDILEDLKDISYSKCGDLIQNRLAIGEEIAKGLQLEFALHISDIFNEAGEKQPPKYAVKHLDLTNEEQDALARREQRD